MKKSLLVLILISLTGPVWGQEEEAKKEDKGGLFIEPMVTYTREEATIKTSQIPLFTDTSGENSGFGLGAKLGFHVSEAVFLGADARFSRLSLTDSSYGDGTGNAYNFGPTVGVQMPVVGLRIFATYVPWGTFDPDAGSNDFDVKFKNGKGFRIGAGFKIAAVSLNLEWQKMKYDDTEVQSIGSYTANGNTSVDYETEGWIASVSFPLAL